MLNELEMKRNKPLLEPPQCEETYLLSRAANEDSNQLTNARSFISLRYSYEKTLHHLLSKNASSDDSDQTVRTHKLIRIFGGRAFDVTFSDVAVPTMHKQ